MMTLMRFRTLFNGGRLPLMITYVVLIVISVIMFVQARNFPASNMGPASPGFFPQVVSVLILLLSVLGLLELRTEILPVVHFRRPVLLGIIASLVYIGVMYVIGYYPSTFLFSIFVMWLVRGQTSFVRISFDSAILVAVSYVLFDVTIGATLPVGILFE